jgi:MoaA/NifB/PqqE/SkfB family radical SAM enzyme
VEPPVLVQVELTSVCNLRCEMCPLTSGTSSTSGQPGHMGPETWAHVLDAARWAGRVAVAGYGEPFLHPACLDMLRQLDAEGIPVALATNGTRVSAATASALGELQHLVEVNLSLDTPEPRAYRALRHGSLGRAIAGLVELVRALDPERLVVSTILLAATAETLPDLPPMLDGLGVRRLALNASHDYNAFSARNRAAVGGAASRAAFDGLSAACADHDVRLELSNPVRSVAEVAGDHTTLARFRPDAWSPALTRQCFVPWEAPFVDKDGGVFPCCFAAAAGEDRMGDVADGLPAVWEGVAFGRFRADLVRGPTPAICRRCTTVPVGRHLYADWAAELVDVARRGRRVRLRYRNVGDRAWTPSDQVRVGTSRPLDGDSALWCTSWLSRNRAATCSEPVVEPGGVATFTFEVRPRARGHVRLVVDDRCWLPNTEVEVTARAGRMWPAIALASGQGRPMAAGSRG